MNRLLPLTLACLAFGTLAGCIGYPPDAARVGDRVTVRYDAVDLDTGEHLVLANLTTIDLGATTPLGGQVSRAMVGHRANDTFDVRSIKDPDLAYTGISEVSAVYQRYPPEQVPVGAFREPPAVGDKVSSSSGTQFEVIHANATTITVRRVLLPPQDIPELGLRLVQRLEGETVAMAVEPLAVRPAFAGPIPPLGLNETGSYRVRALVGDLISFDHSPVADMRLIGRSIAFHLTVVGVEKGARATPTSTDGYGFRGAA